MSDSRDTDDMNARYSAARALAAEVEDACMQLEESGSGMLDTDKLRATERLNELSSMVAAMERDFRESTGLGSMWTYRLQQLREQEKRQREAIGRVMTVSHTTRRRADEREALFQGATTGAATGASLGALGAMERERASLLSAASMMGDIAGTTSAIQGSLRSQSDALKNIQTGVLDILSSIGVSHSLLSSIRRRATGDRVVLWVGVALILLVLFLVYRWTHGGIMGPPAAVPQ